MKDDFNNTSNQQEQENAVSSEHDSLFGTLFFEAFCGSALQEVFAEAMNVPDWASGLDVDQAMDLVDEFWLDRTNGGFKTGVKNGALNGMFNRRGILFPQTQDQNPAMGAGYDMAARGRGSFVTASAPAPY